MAVFLPFLRISTTNKSNFSFDNSAVGLYLNTDSAFPAYISDQLHGLHSVWPRIKPFNNRKRFQAADFAAGQEHFYTHTQMTTW